MQALFCLWWIAASAFAALVMPVKLETSAHRLATEPLSAAAVGLLFWLVFGFIVLISILLCLLLIGIPMLGVEALVYLLVRWFGISVVALWFGRIICQRAGWTTPSPFLPITVGVVALSLVRMIPGIGLLVWIIVGLMGAGISILALTQRADTAPRPLPLPSSGGVELRFLLLRSVIGRVLPVVETGAKFLHERLRGEIELFPKSFRQGLGSGPDVRGQFGNRPAPAERARDAFAGDRPFQGKLRRGHAVLARQGTNRLDGRSGLGFLAGEPMAALRCAAAVEVPGAALPDRHVVQRGIRIAQYSLQERHIAQHSNSVLPAVRQDLELDCPS